MGLDDLEDSRLKTDNAREEEPAHCFFLSLSSPLSFSQPKADEEIENERGEVKKETVGPVRRRVRILLREGRSLVFINGLVFSLYSLS